MNSAFLCQQWPQIATADAVSSTKNHCHLCFSLCQCRCLRRCLCAAALHCFCYCAKHSSTAKQPPVAAYLRVRPLNDSHFPPLVFLLFLCFVLLLCSSCCRCRCCCCCCAARNVGNACAQSICEKNSKIVVKVLINIYVCMLCVYLPLFLCEWF